MEEEEEEEEEEEPFSWLMEFCEPIASQEAELVSCPFAREFEDFEAWSPFHTPSSSASPISPILLVSLPTSPDECAAEEGAAFHAPPEHREDPNPSEVGAPGAERARAVAGEETGGGIEVFEVEIGEGVGSTKVFSKDELVVASILDEWYAENMAAAAAAARQEIEGSMNSGVAELDAINGNHNLGGEIENAEGNCGEKPGDSSGSLSSCEIVGEKSCGTELSEVEKDDGNAEDGDGEIVGDESSEVIETAKDNHGNGGEGSSGKRIEEIVGTKRKLPPSFNRKHKDAGESSEKQSGSPPSFNGEQKDAGECLEEEGEDVGEAKLEFLALLRLHFKRPEEDDDEDYIKAAKERGLQFVKSRAWK